MGWLNPDANDQYRIDQMPGTDEVPAAGALEGLAAAPFKGISEGVLKASDLANDIAASDFGSRAMALVGPFSPSFIQSQGIEAQDIRKNNAAVKVVSGWAATGQDPRVTGSVGRIVGGLAENVTIAGAGAAVGGPWGAAALLGSTEGHADYQQNIADGMDPTTAAEKASLTGGFAAASTFLPMKFESPFALAYSVDANVTFGMAQRGLTSAVLSANGYQQQADQYKIFDKDSIAADTLTGLAFGVMGHRMRLKPAQRVIDSAQHVEAPAGSVTPRGRNDIAAFDPSQLEGLRRGPNPADVDVAQAVEVEDHFNNSAPGVATTPEIANLHAMTLNEAMDAMSKGDAPDVPADVAQKLVDGVVPDPAHEVMAEGVAEAAKDIPGFDSAMADVPRVELPPLRLVDSDFAAEPAHDGNVPMDDYNAATLGSLVENFGDMPYALEDGREVTVKQLADEMQTQRNESERFARLHDVAGACALAHGG
jgi:hypothetical protein